MHSEHPNGAADEHKRAASQIDRAQRLVSKALDDLQEVSSGMREQIIDEKNPSYKGKDGIKDAAERMHDGKKLPPRERDGKAVERARAADSKEKGRQAEQQSDRR